MSTRQLRKLQQQRELEQAKLQAQAEEEESEDEPVVAQKSKPSLFTNLAALEDEADEEEPDEKENEAQEDVKDNHPTPTTASKKSKKSKKKKKAKAKAKAEDSQEREKVDEIDAALKELDTQASSGKSTQQAVARDSEYERICALLSVSTNHLKVANEMRSLFGKEALENLDDAGGPVGRGARRRQRQQRTVDLETALKGHHQPGKGLSELTLRRNYLIQGKEEWPKSTTGGLAMEVVGDEGTNGQVQFRYVHDKTYQALQQTFYALVEIGDPQNLIGLLTRNPYHISLLIQVSKVAKNQGDHALAADLLERALFSFGRAATSIFNTKISQAKVYLDFARPENRELWLAGHHYIKALVMKGTYRTAFEWAKLLLSLSPEEDPYCMHLVIHNLAVRAHEFQWLLDFYSSTNSNKAAWHPSSVSSRIGGYGTASLTLAAVQIRDPIKSREYLSRSMQTTPWLFTRLFKELNLDAPKSIWGIMPRTDAETLFTEIYVLQTKDLWNTTETTALLMEIAHTITKPDIDTIPLLDNNKMSLDVVRYIYLDDNPKLMALVPSSLLHRSNNSDSDPLPPDHNIFSYATQRRVIGNSDRGEGMGDNFNNPIAALANLFGQLNLPGLPGPDLRDEDMQRDIEAAMQEEQGSDWTGDDDDDDEVLEDGNGNRVPISFARRLLDMIWSRGGNDEDEDEDEVDTDTDDGMPPLVPLEQQRRERRATVEDGDESDEDMPPLVD